MRRVSLTFVVLAALSSGSASAQEEAGQYRTAVSAVGGLSVGSSESSRLGGGRGGFGHGGGSGFAVGGGLAHDFSSRLTLEATGLYLDRGSSAWSADAGLRLNLVPSRESLVPYFAVSGGLYGERSSSIADLDDDGGRVSAPSSRGLRPGGRNGAPSPFGRAGATEGNEDVGTSSSGGTNGLLTLGGGVVLSAGPHVFVRPDARAQVVFASGTRVLGLFTLNFGYRF